MIESNGLFSRSGQTVPLQGVSVTGDILGAAARVTIRQRYKNKEARAIEAVYKFPLPEGAAVCGFRVRLDDRVIAGRVEEREKAYKDYDGALIRGDVGYLLEQERPNIFTLYVGNLNPDLEVVVEIDYVTLLDREGDNIRFFLPTTIAPRYIPDRMPEKAGIPESARLHPEYAPEVPYGLSLALNIHDPAFIQAVESPSHLLKIEIGEDPIKVSFYTEQVRMDRDFLLICRRKEGGSRAYAFRAGEETFLQLDLLLEDPRQTAEPAGPAHRRGLDQEVIFLLDCSGSMAGDSIAEAKNALEISLRALAEGALFNIVCFGSTFHSLFEKPRELDDQGFEQARLFLENTGADLGGTELRQPLQAILKTPLTKPGRVIFLITDGQVGNEGEIIQLLDRNREATRLFTIGIGAGPNEYLVKALSRTGGGAVEFIFPGERIEPKVLRVFEKALQPGIARPVIHWGPGAVQAPEAPPLFPGHPVTLFARLGNAAWPEKIHIEGKIGDRSVGWEVETEGLDQEEAGMATLWAWERIRDLEGRIVGFEHGKGEKSLLEEQERHKRELISISRTYEVLSRETDFLAVEERAEAEKAVEAPLVRKIPSLVTAGWHGITTLRDPGISYGQAPAMVANRQASYSIDLDGLKRDRAVFGFKRLSNAPTFRLSDEEEFSRWISPSTEDLPFLLLKKQQVGGGFALDEETAVLLELDFSELVKLAGRITLAGEGDRWRLLSTALVLHVLETRYGDRRDLWEGLVKKSAFWLQHQVETMGPVIDGRELTVWVGDFLKDE
jgi:Ca-activated chloride channel family protein